MSFQPCVSALHNSGYGLMPEELLNGSNVHPLYHPLARPEVAQVMKPHPSQACLLLGPIERSLKTMPGCAVLQADEDRGASLQTWEGCEGLEREFG